jgi:hypothetical protein
VSSSWQRHGSRHVSCTARAGQFLLQRPPVWCQRERLSKRVHGERCLSTSKRAVAAGFVYHRTLQDLRELAHQRIRERRLAVASRTQPRLGVVEASDLAVGHGQRVVDGRRPRLDGQGGLEASHRQRVSAAEQRRTTQSEQRGEEARVQGERALVRGHRGVRLSLVEREVAEPDERGTSSGRRASTVEARPPPASPCMRQVPR